MRLIDAEAFFGKAIEEKRFAFTMEDIFKREKIITTVYNDLYEFIESAPTIDAVPVVRCKDCRYNVANQTRDPYDVTDYTDIVCAWFMTDGMGAEDYCSHGERSADA